MPVSDTSTSFLHFLSALYHYFPIFRSSKLKRSCSSSEPEFFSALYFKRLFDFIISFNALVTRAFSSSPLAGRFMVPWNLTQPAPLPRAVDQVNLIALFCAYITLHELISCPGPCRGHTGWFFFYVFLFASSSEGSRPGMTLRSAPTWRIGGVHRTVWVFLIISFTLRVENFLGSF